MVSFWTNLSQREKMLIGVGLPILLSVIFYLYLWQPTYDRLTKLRLQVPENNATYQWMQYRLEGKQAGSSEDDDAAATPLLTSLEKLAIATRIQSSIQRTQPGNDGSVEFWFQDVVADNLFNWMDRLAGDSIDVESATITRNAFGLVSARVKVKRRG